MECPFKNIYPLKHPNKSCNKNCAWLVTIDKINGEDVKACAVSVIAMDKLDSIKDK